MSRLARKTGGQELARSGRRSRLLKAATRLFASRGYAGTSVRDILKVAKVSAPVLYYHFGSKEGLFLALAREGTSKIDTAIQEAIASPGTVTERLRRFCLAIVSVRREFVDLAWVVEAILTGPPEAAPRFDFRSEFHQMFRQLEGLVREGVESGELRPGNPTHAALMLLGFMEVASRPRMAELVGLTADAEIGAILSAILSSLATSPK